MNKTIVLYSHTIVFYVIIFASWFSFFQSCEKYEDYEIRNVYAEQIFMVSGSQVQGAACYGDILFQFTSQNDYKTGNCLMIIDLRQKRELQSIELEYNINFHNSTVSFGVERFSQSDTFPLLYVSENYSPNAYYKIHVYRIVEDAFEHQYSLSEVQVIDMPNPSLLDSMQYPHAAVDTSDASIWIEGYSADGRMSLFRKFRLPALSEGAHITLNEEHLDSIAIPRDNISDQSFFIKDGFIYQVIGYHYNAFLRIIEKRSKTLTQNVSFNRIGINSEPEAVFFWDKCVCVTFADRNVFKLHFK